jgi:hypothetical protein
MPQKITLPIEVHVFKNCSVFLKIWKFVLKLENMLDLESEVLILDCFQAVGTNVTLRQELNIFFDSVSFVL